VEQVHDQSLQVIGFFAVCARVVCSRQDRRELRRRQVSDTQARSVRARQGKRAGDRSYVCRIGMGRPGAGLAITVLVHTEKSLAEVRRKRSGSRPRCRAVSGNAAFALFALALTDPIPSPPSGRSR
jgi:hypothetical protein